jgi:Flp pilus assembly protein TadG
MLRILRCRRRSLRQCEQGSAALEFVFLLPLLLVLLFGFVGVGQLLWFHHIVSKGVRDGTRYLTRTDLAEEDAAKNVALTGLPAAGSAYGFWNDPGTITIETTEIDNTAGTWHGPDTITIIRMTAEVPVDPWGLGWLGIGTTTIRAVDEARHIGD